MNRSSPLFVLLLAMVQGQIDLEFIAKEPGPGFPLQECQGDCDNDDECAGNLRCFQRFDATPIPGCDNDTPAIFGDDFCYNGPSFIKWRGNNGNGPFPLGECEGDCDNDGECENGLICFHRGTADVPGCLGPPGTSDYCVIPVPGLLTQRTPKKWTTSAPILNECEGDCNVDADCAGTLSCFQRQGFEPVPGCDGLGNEGTDYCFQAPNNFLNRIGNNIFGPENPLNLCEGDCDDDDDCAGDLVCHQRDGLDPVPGCIGTPNWNTDYCIDESITPAPSERPSAMPSPSPTVSSAPTGEKMYEYTGTNTAKDGQVNEDDRPCGDVNGPAPNADGSDLVMRFFVIGDTPYDKSNKDCLDVANNVVVEDCPFWDCDGVPPVGNTCMWTGGDYDCLKDTLIPYMKTQNDKVAFTAHIGDIVGGMGLMNSRCNFAAFDLRRDLFAGFQPDMDFVIVPGDNEWNECLGFDENSNDDAMKTLWRERFGDSNSPFYSFTRDFPGTPINGYPARPTLERQEDANDVNKNNPENFFFKHNNVAFFGLNDLNTLRGPAWVGQNAQNAAWVTDKLGSDCSFESIVIFTQTFIRNGVQDALDDYFTQCGGDKPVLNLTGDKHPQVYCGNQNGKIMKITVEAFKAAPLLVSIIADPSDGKHYFHAEPTSPGTPYGVCGDTFLQVPN